jgi:hypothetical protein
MTTLHAKKENLILVSRAILYRLQKSLKVGIRHLLKIFGVIRRDPTYARITLIPNQSLNYLPLPRYLQNRFD